MPSVKRRHREGFNPGTPVPRAGQAAWGEFEIPNAPVGGGLNYGPVVGGLTGAAAVAAVKANTSPRAVTRPSTVNVECFPTDTTAQIRTKIAGATGIVWFNKGLYPLRGGGDPNEAALRLYPANNGVTLVLESAAGYTRTQADSVVFDAGGTQMSCFINSDGQSQLSNVTVRGGMFQNIGFSSGNQYDWGYAVRLGGFGHTIEDAIAQNNQCGGFKIDGGIGPGLITMRRLYTYNNGLSGLSAWGGTTGYLITNCRANYNCTRSNLPTSDPHWVSSGANDSNTKFFIDDATFEGNWIHDGNGFGLWNDWKHYNTTVTNNVIENNRSAGMFWENTRGNNRFYHNYFRNNGNVNTGTGWMPYGASNLLLTGPNAVAGPGDNDPTYGYPIIDIAYNDFDNYGNGDPNPIYQWPRGEYPFKPPHPWGVLVASYGGTSYVGGRGVKIHHNRMWFRGTGLGAGGYDDTVAQALWAETTNEWHHNEYRVQSLSASNWYWQHVPYTWAQWQGAGKDVGSSRALI